MLLDPSGMFNLLLLDSSGMFNLFTPSVFTKAKSSNDIFTIYYDKIKGIVFSSYFYCVHIVLLRCDCFEVVSRSKFNIVQGTPLVWHQYEIAGHCIQEPIPIQLR